MRTNKAIESLRKLDRMMGFQPFASTVAVLIHERPAHMAIRSSHQDSLDAAAAWCAAKGFSVRLEAENGRLVIAPGLK